MQLCTKIQSATCTTQTSCTQLYYLLLRRGQHAHLITPQGPRYPEGSRSKSPAEDDKQWKEPPQSQQLLTCHHRTMSAVEDRSIFSVASASPSTSIFSATLRLLVYLPRVRLFRSLKAAAAAGSYSSCFSKPSAAFFRLKHTCQRLPTLVH